MKTVSFKQYEIVGRCEVGLVLKHLDYNDIEIVQACRFIFNDAGDSIHFFVNDGGEVVAELHREVVTPASDLAARKGITNLISSAFGNAFRGKVEPTF